MGIGYNVYIEAKVNNIWVNIDYYCKDVYGKAYLIPAAEGTGSFGETVEELQLKIIGMNELNPYTKAEILKWDNEYSKDQYNLFTISYTDLVDTIDMRNNEYNAFASKYEVKLFENRKINEIDDWVSNSEFSQMENVKQEGYMYYEWTERYGKFQYYKKLLNEIDNRMKSYQSKVLFNTELLYETLKRNDIRLIIVISISYCIEDAL